ncbi:hypothetical protein KGQ20_07720 [Catenulispora sp. NF23]|uniref:Uncharacterized protein n=1 Tax=Catenulispora pinistramenti TaxID=2705254 RepID=A0ABS5KNK1_9ACTN|nr:hypothetical protein [Catenulispora pinistramenti]MBS2532659.1 hypothetical protein [Catenulispora pinistramenti]MBS2547584.1 hypothetical protein [Catenulispora pinistramenti]
MAAALGDVIQAGQAVADAGLVTSRKPDDLPKCCAKLVAEFAQGRHADQARSASR